MESVTLDWKIVDFQMVLPFKREKKSNKPSFATAEQAEFLKRSTKHKK